MKKFFYPTCLVLFSLLCVTSCGDDDDDASASPVVNGITTDYNGKKVLLTRVGENYINYDENGRITGLGDMDVAGKSFILTEEEGDEKDTYVVTLNSKGLITQISSVLNDYDGDEDAWWRAKGKVTFSYNSSKQLTSVAVSGNGAYFYDDEKVPESWSSKTTFTWAGGNIKKATEKSTEKYKDEGKTLTETTVCNYEYLYGDEMNPLLQVSLSMQYPMFDPDDPFCVIGCLGFLGVGTAYFPIAINGEDTEYVNGVEENQSAFTADFSYTFNNNTTISAEDYCGATFDYGYSILSEAKVRNRAGVSLAKALKSLAHPQKRKSLRARRAAKR